MYGLVTRNAAELEWAEFDTGYYEVKDVTGRRTTPIGDAVNMVSCFGDSRRIESEPELAAKNAAGEPATRDQPYFDWGTVCPSREEYQAELIELIEDCVAESPDLRLDDVGYPRHGYCHCEVCERRFAASPLEDWHSWRADVITDFVEQAVEQVPGRTALTVYPDPYPGHLFERSGIDLEALESCVDEFIVPLYDMAYSTTYWLEALAMGFRDRLQTPLSVELYAVDVETEALARAARVVDAYAESVLFAYDAENGQAAVRRLAGEDSP